MAKDLELDKWDAVDRLKLFLKLRKNKPITDKTIKDFEGLTGKMWDNFKGHNEETVTEYHLNNYRVMERVCMCLSSDFIQMDTGGIYRKKDISEFAFYKDKKHRAKIKDETIEISENDFKVLKYLFSIK